MRHPVLLCSIVKHFVVAALAAYRSTGLGLFRVCTPWLEAAALRVFIVTWRSGYGRIEV